MAKEGHCALTLVQLPPLARAIIIPSIYYSYYVCPYSRSLDRAKNVACAWPCSNSRAENRGRIVRYRSSFDLGASYRSFQRYPGRHVTYRSICGSYRNRKVLLQSAGQVKNNQKYRRSACYQFLSGDIYASFTDRRAIELQPILAAPGSSSF